MKKNFLKLLFIAFLLLCLKTCLEPQITFWKIRQCIKEGKSEDLCKWLNDDKPIFINEHGK